MTPTASPTRPPRRWRRSCCGGCSLVLAAVLLLLGYMFLQARQLHVTHPVISISGLPPAFSGLRVAEITDIHRGPWLSQQRVRNLVKLTNAQHPDLVAICGDMVHRSPEYIPQVWRAMAGLHAPLGVYAVLGNHDHWESAALSYKAMKSAGVVNLTNRHVAVHRRGATLYLAGVDDMWTGHPDFHAALAGIPQDAVVIMLCHNPDYFETHYDPRAKLWLAGHTHGGQVYMPWLFKPVVPSAYGTKYRCGLVRRKGAQIYVSRGIGTITPPLRFDCPAELPIIELRRAAARKP